MDDVAVIMIVAPIFAPIVKTLGFDPIWFAVLFMINMQCAWITPPYGFNLFIMRAVTPKEISTWDIYKSVVPFIGLQLIALTFSYVRSSNSHLVAVGSFLKIKKCIVYITLKNC